MAVMIEWVGNDIEPLTLDSTSQDGDDRISGSVRGRCVLLAWDCAYDQASIDAYLDVQL